MKDRWCSPPSWLEWPIVEWLRNPYVQMRLGAWGLGITTAAWLPLRFAVVSLGEPEIVFHLSMAAIWISALTLVMLTDVGETVK